MNILIKALATARLTRFITTDTLPEWLVIGRIRRWGDGHERALFQWMTDVKDRRLLATSEVRDAAVLCLREYEYEAPITWQARLASGLECPFCVGFWVGAAVLLLPDNRLTRWLLGALALNYVVGHVSSQLDDDTRDGE